MTGPESVSAGEYVFVFTDNSSLATDSAPVDLWVREYLDGRLCTPALDVT